MEHGNGIKSQPGSARCPLLPEGREEMSHALRCPCEGLMTGQHGGLDRKVFDILIFMLCNRFLTPFINHQA